MIGQVAQDRQTSGKNFNRDVSGNGRERFAKNYPQEFVAARSRGAASKDKKDGYEFYFLIPTQEGYGSHPMHFTMQSSLCWTYGGGYGIDEGFTHIDDSAPWMQAVVDHSKALDPSPWPYTSGSGFEAKDNAPVLQPYLMHSTRVAASLQSAAQPESSLKAGMAGQPSAGSAGHPYRCAEPCKYVKKPRGCKDGSACARCHMCEWKKKSTVW